MKPRISAKREIGRAILRRAIGPLSNRFNSESIHSYRIPNPSPRVAFRGLQKPDNLIGGSLDCPSRAEKPLHLLEPAFHPCDAARAFCLACKQRRII